MRKRITNMVGPGNMSDNPVDISSYSYCSSDSEQKPEWVVWPTTAEQARRVLLYANQTHTPIILRGSGTSKSDGSISEGALVLSSEKMNKITKLDMNEKIVEVDSGIRISDLNNSLAEFKMFFPLVPFNPVKTIGGMIALNAITKESQGLGRMEDWVEEVGFVDGTGKHYNTKKKEVIVGVEGLTGFITKAKLRITEIPPLSVDIFSFNELSEMLRQVRLMQRDVELYFLEFLDKLLGEELGFEKRYVLIAAYTSLKGKNKEVAEVRRVIEKIDSVHQIIRSRGYYYIQDPYVGLDKAYDLIEWCENSKVALHGHIGLGQFYTYFKKEDKDLAATFHSFIRRINGSLGQAFGIGSLNKSFVNPVKKKAIIKLKDEYDYNNILNQDKMINYR